MSREFEITREAELPASPDDIWTAITADPAAWMFPTGMEIPAGAAPPEGAPVTTWDPPHRLVIRMESPDGTFNALDYAIEARAGGTAHLRYVHSGILADGWEDQYDAIGGHTDFYLHTLGQYLEHFNGGRVTYVGQPSDGINGPETAGRPDAMDTLRAALGVSSDSAVGAAVHTSLGDAGTLDGVIDYSTPEFPRRPHRRRPVPLLRTQPPRRRRRDERAPVRRWRRRRSARSGAQGVAGPGVRVGRRQSCAPAPRARSGLIATVPRLSRRRPACGDPS
jgi:uncharacterized protein YndB with AHSA1/START domain